MNYDSLKEMILKFIPKTNQEAEALVSQIVGALNVASAWVQDKFVVGFLPAIKIAGNLILWILEKIAGVIRWLMSLLP